MTQTYHSLILMLLFLMNYFNEKTLDSGEIYSYEKNNTDFNIKKTANN